MPRLSIYFSDLSSTLCNHKEPSQATLLPHVLVHTGASLLAPHMAPFSCSDRNHKYGLSLYDDCSCSDDDNFDLDNSTGRDLLSMDNDSFRESARKKIAKELTLLHSRPNGI